MNEAFRLTIQSDQIRRDFDKPSIILQYFLYQRRGASQAGHREVIAHEHRAIVRDVGTSTKREDRQRLAMSINRSVKSNIVRIEMGWRSRSNCCRYWLCLQRNAIDPFLRASDPLRPSSLKIGGAICARTVNRAHSKKNRAISHIAVTFDLGDLLCHAAQVATYLEANDPV